MRELWKQMVRSSVFDFSPEAKNSDHSQGWEQDVDVSRLVDALRIYFDDLRRDTSTSAHRNAGGEQNVEVSVLRGYKSLTYTLVLHCRICLRWNSSMEQIYDLWQKS